MNSNSIKLPSSKSFNQHKVSLPSLDALPILPEKFFLKNQHLLPQY